MGFFSRFFGHKWALHVCYAEESLYSMQHDSPNRIIGYIMRYFIDGGSPVPPWSLHFVFRNNKASFELSPKYFLKDGKEDLSLFDKAVNSIDINPTRGNYEPVCVNHKTRKTIQISHLPENPEECMSHIMDRLRNPKASQYHREETFFDVLDKVFGVDQQKV